MNIFSGAIRQLVKRPALSAIIVVTLALGVGANAAMFSLFHQVLLRPLPVPHPEQLVLLSATGPKTGSVSCSGMGECGEVFSYPMLRDLEQAAEPGLITGIAAHRAFNASIAAEGRAPLIADGMVVNGSYFSVLKLKPALGRLIGPQDDRQVGEGRVVVLDHDYWQNHFGGDPGVLGEIVTVNGAPLTVIGVAPDGFSGASIGAQPRVYVPLTLRWLMEPQFDVSSENRLAYWVYLFTRLEPGVTKAAAENALNVSYRAIINEIEAPMIEGGSEQFMANFRESRLELLPGASGQSRVDENARVPLTLLLGVTALVLAIACVNIANLLLTRGAMRAGEMALRAAIGASRGQMVVQLLSEAALLGLLGCLAGLPVAAATLNLISAIMPAEVATTLDVGLSEAAIVFAIVVSLATVLLFGLFPALAATRAAPGMVLKSQAGQQSAGRGMARFRRVLATAQIAFSLVLLALAGLFAQSLANAARVDLGMNPDPVATFSVAPALNGYSPQRSLELFERIETELAALPGVTNVASSMVPVIAGSSWGGNVSVQGFEPAPDADTNAQYNKISPGFFRTLQIPLLSGRDFGDADIAGRPKVAIVNEVFAEKFGLGEDVVGKRMAIGAGGPLDIEIVGLVADARYSEVKDEVPPQFFLPRMQDAELGFLNFYVRGELPPADLVASLPQVVAAIDPNLPVNGLATLPDVIRDNLFLDRMIGMLSGGFAALATLLAATGLYGVLAYSVAQRTREFGVRQALGATSYRLRAMVIRQVGWMALIGSALGLVLAVALGRAAEAVLFGVSGHEPLVLVAATGLLGAVIIAAAWLPAYRATCVSAIEALRYE